MLTSSRMTFLSEKKVKRKEQLDMEALVNGLAYGKFETGSIENAEKRVQVDWGRKPVVRICTNMQNTAVVFVLS